MPFNILLNSGYNFETKEPVKIFSLPVPGSYRNVLTLLSLYLRDLNTSKKVVFKKFPDYIYVSSQAIDEVANEYVNFMKEAEFIPTISKNKKLVFYQLKGVAIRRQQNEAASNENGKGGHYVSMVNIDGQWKYMNDASNPNNGKTFKNLYNTVYTDNTKDIAAINFSGYAKILEQQLKEAVKLRQ